MEVAGLEMGEGISKPDRRVIRCYLQGLFVPCYGQFGMARTFKRAGHVIQQRGRSGHMAEPRGKNLQPLESVARLQQGHGDMLAQAVAFLGVAGHDFPVKGASPRNVALGYDASARARRA